jgi:hypothetical protein
VSDIVLNKLRTKKEKEKKKKKESGSYSISRVEVCLCKPSQTDLCYKQVAKEQGLCPTSS